MVHSYQIVSSILLILIIVYLINNLKKTWFGPEDFWSKVIITLYIDRFIGLSLFLFKLCLYYDKHLIHPWKDGAFGRSSNFWPFFRSIPLCINAFIAFQIMDSLILSIIFIITLLLIEEWIVRLGFIMKENWFKEERPDMSGFNATLSEIHKRRLEVSGYIVLNETLGYGHYGTVYKCNCKIIINGTESIERKALKVIDISKLIKYRFRELEPELEMDLRNMIDNGLEKLSAIKHKNIVQFETINTMSATGGRMECIALFSKLANFNLDCYLTHEKPDGVGEDCARFWLRQLCGAVEYLHKDSIERTPNGASHPIPHCNIKPENVLFYKRAEDNRVINPEIDFDVKLADCGLALLFPSLGKVTTKQKPTYFISPPQNLRLRKTFEFKENYEKVYISSSVSDDIYNLGVILVLLVKGNIENIVENPKESLNAVEFQEAVNGVYVEFTALKVKQLPGDISPQLYQLLRKMLLPIRKNRIGIISVKNHSWIMQNVNPKVVINHNNE